MVKINQTIPTLQQNLGRFSADGHRPLMAMVEITGKCNMACPICFAGATSTAGDISFGEVKKRIDRLVEVSGIIPLQISGGEPTLSDDLADIISYARQCGFVNIELVTNGIRISREPELLQKLAEKGLSAVYLQFDGLLENSHIQIRGQDMREVREKAVAACRSAKLCCTLAVAVTRNVNDMELGDIIRYAAKNIDTVRAINFQAAVPFSGRFDIAEEGRGYRLDELVSLIEEQAGLVTGGFLNDVLSHHQCNAVSLVYLVDGRLESLFNYLSRESIDRFIGSNKRQTILDLFLGKKKFVAKYLVKPKNWKMLLEASAIFGPNPRPESILGARHLLLFAKSFMEKDDVSGERLGRCAYAMATSDGPISFCAYNHFHRNQSARSER